MHIDIDVSYNGQTAEPNWLNFFSSVSKIPQATPGTIQLVFSITIYLSHPFF